MFVFCSVCASNESAMADVLHAKTFRPTATTFEHHDGSARSATNYGNTVCCVKLGYSHRIQGEQCMGLLRKVHCNAGPHTPLPRVVCVYAHVRSCMCDVCVRMQWGQQYNWGDVWLVACRHVSLSWVCAVERTTGVPPCRLYITSRHSRAISA